jgi:hypothetical protein
MEAPLASYAAAAELFQHLISARDFLLELQADIFNGGFEEQFLDVYDAQTRDRRVINGYMDIV